MRKTFWHNELQTSVENWLKAQAAGLYDEGIGKFLPRYEKVYVGESTMQRSSWQLWLNLANKMYPIFTVRSFNFATDRILEKKIA